MGLASLGFADGVGLTFRIDPTSLDFKVQVDTNVEQTVAGRVVQITGSSVTDLIVSGSLGEDHNRGKATGSATEHPGVGWKQAEEFFTAIQSMMSHQSAGSTTVGVNGVGLPTPTFIYSPLNLKFPCYIKSIVDPDGDGQSGVVHKVGRSNYRYTLTLFPVLNGSDQLLQAGQAVPNGKIDAAKAAAIDAYINRISAGIGWRFTQYNGGATASSPWTK